MGNTIKARDINGNSHSYNKDEFGITVSAYGLATDSKKLLLIREKVSKKLSLPGGEINFEEDIIEGLKREFKEETSLEVLETKIIDAGTDLFNHPTLGLVKSYLLFYCVVLKDYKIMNTYEPDVSWVDWVLFKTLDFTQIHSIFHNVIKSECLKKKVSLF